MAPVVTKLNDAASDHYSPNSLMKAAGGRENTMASSISSAIAVPSLQQSSVETSATDSEAVASNVSIASEAHTPTGMKQTLSRLEAFVAKRKSAAAPSNMIASHHGHAVSVAQGNLHSESIATTSSEATVGAKLLTASAPPSAAVAAELLRSPPVTNQITDKAARQNVTADEVKAFFDSQILLVVNAASQLLCDSAVNVESFVSISDSSLATLMQVSKSYLQSSGATKSTAAGEYNADSEADISSESNFHNNTQSIHEVVLTEQPSYREVLFHDRSHYEGEWQDGLFQGQGVYTFADGSRYEGQWRKGKKNGYGKHSYGTAGETTLYSWSAGDVYDGEWKSHQRHGSAVYTWSNGSQLACVWFEGHCDQWLAMNKKLFQPQQISTTFPHPVKEHLMSHLPTQSQAQHGPLLTYATPSPIPASASTFPITFTSSSSSSQLQHLRSCSEVLGGIMTKCSPQTCDFILNILKLL